MGRLIYYGAPVFVGWGLGVIAARQRMKAVWPVAGIVLACLAGAMAQVRVGAGGERWAGNCSGKCYIFCGVDDGGGFALSGLAGG
jgi:hypothetical protein